MDTKFNFENAFHVSKNRSSQVQGFFVVGVLLILFSGIVLLIFNGEKTATEETWHTVLIICLAVITLGIILITLSIIVSKKKRKHIKVCFAIFSDYILISNNLYKEFDLNIIRWVDICEYSFNEHMKGENISTITTAEGRFSIGGNKLNYGGLRVITKDKKYETNIENINEARDLFKLHCTIAEKFDTWNDIKS